MLFVSTMGLPLPLVTSYFACVVCRCKWVVDSGAQSAHVSCVTVQFVGHSSQKVAGSKQRKSYIQNVIGHSAVTTRFQDNRTVMQEKFVPPHTSMATYLMTKVLLICSMLSVPSLIAVHAKPWYKAHNVPAMVSVRLGEDRETMSEDLSISAALQWYPCTRLVAGCRLHRLKIVPNFAFLFSLPRAKI